MADETAEAIENFFIFLFILSIIGAIIYQIIRRSKQKKEQQSKLEPELKDADTLLPNHLIFFKQAQAIRNQKISLIESEETSETKQKMQASKQKELLKQQQQKSQVQFVDYSQLPISILPFSYRSLSIGKPEMKQEEAKLIVDEDESSYVIPISEDDVQAVVKQHQSLKVVFEATNKEYQNKLQESEIIEKNHEVKRQKQLQEAANIIQNWENQIEMEKAKEQEEKAQKKTAFGAKPNAISNKTSERNNK